MSEISSVKFKTKKAREFSLKLINKIKKHLSLSSSTSQLERFLPTADANEIVLRQNWIRNSIKQVGTIQNIPVIQDLLNQASTFNKDINKRHNNIVIAFGNEDDYDKNKSELSKKFYTTLVQTEHDLLSISHYEQIRYIPSDRDLIASSVEELKQATIYDSGSSIYDIAPEIYTDIVEENKNSLSAINLLSDFLDITLEIPSFNSQETRFEHVETDIDNAIKILQELIQSQISISQFSGEQLVSIIQNNEKLLDKLPNNIQELIMNKKRELIKNIDTKYGLSCFHCITIDHIGKVLLDEQEIEKLNTSFLAKIQQESSEHKQSIANQSRILIEKMDVILNNIFELDFKIAVSLFSKEYDLEFPIISGQGMSFVYGRNMNLLEPVPVEYYIGEEEHVAVITGANSGGKTTLLELLAQVQILAQMGLGVPAKQARVGVCDEIYYFSKNKGSVNAGAFETLLKQFSSISDDDSNKLILADEIESVTEPDVAAKIIKGIIHHSQKTRNNILILVTHMGKELDFLNVNARFDGIEAKGLDKDFNLVVDRNPVIGRIARSTPQLIIERLAKKNKGEFYSYLHKLVSTS